MQIITIECLTTLAERQPTSFTDLILCINQDCNLLDACINFNDLKAEINRIDFSNIATLRVTHVPAYRDINFEDIISRYIFNKVSIQEATMNNAKYSVFIFGEII